MERFFNRSVLSLAIAAALFASANVAKAELLGGKITFDGLGFSEFNNVLNDFYNGNHHKVMEVKNYNIVDFQEGSGFNGLSIKAAISLGGGNGYFTGKGSGQDYGDLSLGVYNSSIKGEFKPSDESGKYGESNKQWMGLYSRTDSDKSTVEIESNSIINLKVESSTANVQGAGIYSENFGERGNSHITLLEGSNISIEINDSEQKDGYNSGVFTFADKGSTRVIAQEETTIVTKGLGMDGIKSVSRDGALIINAGKIINNGDKSKGIHSHTQPGTPGLGVVNIANLKNAAIDVTGEDSYGIFAFSFGEGGG